MKLNILISTINEAIYKIENLLMTSHPEISYIISHQLTYNQDYSGKLAFLDRDDIVYVTMSGKGLSRNRNHTFKYADGDLLLICDDDVELIEKHILQIPRIFEKYSDIDMIRFQVQTFSGKPYKKYINKIFNIRRIAQLTNVSSVEMVIRHSFLKEHSILFDERFGIASEYEVGEDFIFATDILKANGNIIHYPLDIVKHDAYSTGGKLTEDVIFGRGAVFSRVFGYSAFIVNLYFSLKHRKEYKQRYTFYQYFKIMLEGSYDFLKRRCSHE